VDHSDIAPLAKRLAEENNVDWRRLRGSGEGGRVVERDVLEYLARVMAGEEAVDPTPEPVPEGMGAWPEADVRRGTPSDTPAASPSERATIDPTSTIEDDIFIFDDEGADAVSAAPATLTTEPAPLWRSEAPHSGDAFDDDDDGLLLVEDDDEPIAAEATGTDGDGETASRHEPWAELQPTADPTTPTAAHDEDQRDTLRVTDPWQSAPSVDAEASRAANDLQVDATPWDSGPDLELSDAADDGDLLAAPNAATPELPDLFSGDDRGDVDLETPAGYASAPVFDLDAGDEATHAHSFAAPPATAAASESPEPASGPDSGAGWDAIPSLDAAEELSDEPVPTPPDVVAAVPAPPVAEPLAGAGSVDTSAAPLVRHGHVWRRQVDLSAMVAAQADLAAELGRGEPIVPLAFLVRAGAKALGDAEASLAVAYIDGEGVRTVPVRGAGDFSATVSALDALPGEVAADATAAAPLALVVADLSELGLDDAVLHLGAPVLTLGRVLIDNQTGARRAYLALSGDGAEGAEAARLLARVADLLETPVRLAI